MQTRTALLVVVLVLSAVGGPAVGLAGAADVALEVVIRTAAGGSLSNAEVTATWDGGSRTRTTSSNGRVYIDVPEGEEVTIEVDHPFYVRNAPYEVTNAAAEEVVVTVWEEATASVTVVDKDGPVEDARVVFRKQGAIVTTETTDSEGTVDSGVIESGEYTISVRKPEYYRQVESRQVRGDVNEEISIERGSVTFEFRVLDDHFDPPQPIEGASISGPDFSTITQSNGGRTVSLAVNTEPTVTIEKDGYESIERTILVRESDRQVNLTTRREAAVQVELSNERVVVGESLRVTITDEYGDPLPAATVYLDGEAIGQSDSNGGLQLAIESAGEHTLFAQVEQLSSDQRRVTGVQPGSGGSNDGGLLGTPAGAAADVSGFLALPALGALHLRSVAIGAAGGLMLAVILFLYVRFD